MIVKFCDRSHNPFVSETSIQLGTLYYYSSTDNDFIRDRDEGEINRTFHPPRPAVYTGNDIARMTGLPISGTGTIRFAGRAVKTTHPLPNAYVFCTSRLLEPTLEHAALFGYNSWYVIRDASGLCNAVAREVRRQVAPDSDILAFHGEVSYQEVKEVVYSDISDFFRSHHVIDPGAYLLKRQRSRQDGLKVYAREQEYRFVFLPVGEDRRPIPLAKDRICLDASCISQFIEEGAV